MSLYLRILEDESRETLENDHRLFPRETYLPDLSNNIKCGNTLFGTDCIADTSGDVELLHRLNPFDWKDEFPSIMRSGGFDIVIGNPPYFSIDDTWGKGDYRLSYLKRNYGAVYNDKTDVLFYFLKRAVDLAKTTVCFIVSRAFLEAYKADKLRGWLAANTRIVELIDFRDRHVFPGVGIATAIISLKKGRDEESARIWQLTSSNGDLDHLSERLVDDTFFGAYVAEQNHFTSEPWSFADSRDAQLLDKVDAAGDSVGQILKIGQGMQTGLNTVFGKLDQETVDSWDVPKGMYFVRARNSDIDAYHINKSPERILYLEDQRRIGDLPPKVQQHLRKNAESLKSRAAFIRGNCEWWKYTWPLHKELYGRRKIYCPYLAPYNRFALDLDRTFLGLTDTTVLFDADQPEDIRYILACLNSKLLTFRFRFIGKLKGGGIYEYFENSISKLPIRRINLKNRHDREIHDRLCESVSNIMTLKSELALTVDSRSQGLLRRAIGQTDAQINRDIYSLYGLNEDEIRTVEASVLNGALAN